MQRRQYHEGSGASIRQTIIIRPRTKILGAWMTCLMEKLSQAQREAETEMGRKPWNGANISPNPTLDNLRCTST